MEKTDIRFIGSVMELYKEFEEKGISLVYFGKFNHKITKMFISLSSDETELNNESRAVKRKLHHSVVEILQNLIKYSVHLFNNVKFAKGIFILGKKDNVYYIITVNEISINNIPKLTNSIDSVNKLGRVGLKEMYKKQLINGSVSKKGGAGLGFIDIARKTGNKLEYHFLPINDEQKYFVLKIKVDAKPA